MKTKSEHSGSGAVLGLCVGLFLGLNSQAATCVPAPSGIVSWWRAENNALDSIGTNHGALLNGVTFTNGEAGKGFVFSGSGDDYVELPGNVFPVPTTGDGHIPFSFEVWFKTTLYGAILGQQDQIPFVEGMHGYVPAMYVATNGLLYAQLFWGTGSQLVSTTPVNNGNFHHAVITYDGANEFLYVDGVLIGGRGMTQQAYATYYYYQLGTAYTDGWDDAPGGWYPFHGVVDEVTLYNRALTSGEVSALYNAGTAGKCTAASFAGPLRHRYSFNEPAGSRTVTDSVGSANGTLYFATTNAPYTNGVSDGSAFSGTGQLTLNGGGFVDLPDGIVSGLSNLTIEAWITWQIAAVAGWQRIFDFGGNSNGPNASGTGTNYLVLTPERGDSRVVGFIETTRNPAAVPPDPNALNLSGNNKLVLGSESYVAVTYNPTAGSSQIFVNGTLVASVSGAPLNALSKISDYNNYLGRSQYPDALFIGQFNEFRIWETVLTQQQIADHFSAGPDQQLLTVTRPTLAIARTGANLVLTWPTNSSAGFQLQSCTNLRTPNWQTVSAAATVSNTLYRVALPATNSPTFFRLRM